MEPKLLHLALQTALPRRTPKRATARSESNQRPHLSEHKLALLERTLVSVRLAAQECLDRFQPQQDSLWWQPTDEDGHYLLDKNTQKPIQRIAGSLRVVIKLRQLAPLRGFALPAVIKDGIHHKVADLLLSFAKRRLDPRFKDKTSYPTINEGFPIVLQGGFVFYEHALTGKFYLYLPLFPRGGHEEDLPGNFDPTDGPRLRVFGEDEIKILRARGGLLLPLQFDKWGEATFIRDSRFPPVWKATHRQVDQRWLNEIAHDKDFSPKRIEVFEKGDQILVNIASSVPTQTPIEVTNFMGVSFNLEDLVTVVVINPEGKIIHQRVLSAAQYEHQYLTQLKRLRERGGGFAQTLELRHYEEVARIVAEAQQFQAAIAVETVGDINKGKYSPRMNLRLSYWPFGKLADFISYKSVYAGLPKPYGVYSGTVKTKCHNCGADNKEEREVLLEGISSYCGRCGTRFRTGFNAALNLALRAQELHTRGVVAR